LQLIRRRYADAFYNYAFTFDNVYGPESDTSSVYASCCREVAHKVVEGYNSTILLYGQTTTGKTYTMLGSQDSPGVLPYALHDTFTLLQKKTNECSSSRKDVVC
jgi:centromeric protein E